MLWLLSWCWSCWLAAVVKVASLLGTAGLAVQVGSTGVVVQVAVQVGLMQGEHALNGTAAMTCCVSKVGFLHHPSVVHAALGWLCI
jgi:hypothetical protein